VSNHTYTEEQVRKAVADAFGVGMAMGLIDAGVDPVTSIISISRYTDNGDRVVAIRSIQDKVVARLVAGVALRKSQEN